MAENEGPNEEQDNEPDYAGYRSVEELAAAYRASGTEAKKWKTAADQALIQLQSLSQANPRQDVPQRNGSYIQQSLAEAGIPEDPMRQLAREEAQRMIREEFVEPMQRANQARGKMLGQYKDYPKFESDVYAFIESDPEVAQDYNAMFKVAPASAMEYAFLKFGDAQRREHKGGRRSAEPSTEAQIPSNRSGESRRGPSGGDTLQRAYDAYREDPNQKTARDYAKARLHGVIKDDFLNQ